METVIDGSEKYFEARGFKSYYVVWKPEEKWETLAFRLRFKSYYVVWKHKNKIKTNTR